MSNHSTVDFKTKIEMLERTVLELGTELYQMKATVVKTKDDHERFLAIVGGLKQLLDEKGVITIEDFESAVELGEAIERFNSQNQHRAYDELERIKKESH